LSLRNAHFFSWALFVFILLGSLVYIYTFPLGNDIESPTRGPQVAPAFAQAGHGSTKHTPPVATLTDPAEFPSAETNDVNEPTAQNMPAEPAQWRESAMDNAVILAVEQWDTAMDEALEAPASAEPQKLSLVVDDFEGSAVSNALKRKANVYVKAPSQIMVRQGPGENPRGKSLKIRYAKHNVGGPYEQGGWCGYYTLLKDDKADAAAGEQKYFDASEYTAIAFWVRGEQGTENFVVGLADSHWDQVGDSLKSEDIGQYLPSGKVTTEWQQAVIPLETFFLDVASLSSIAIGFEADCFPQGKGAGIVYIDDLGFI